MTVPPTDDLDPATAVLGGLLAWESIFGPRPLTWSDLRDLGTGLSAAEGRDYLQRQLADRHKARLYQALFHAHPALRADVEQDGAGQVATIIEAQRERSQRAFPRSQFLARLTAAGGPSPHEELEAVLERARAEADGGTWLPTRAAAASWRRAPWPAETLGLFFYVLAGGGVQGVVARVRSRQHTMPQSTALRRLYEEGKSFQSWWEVVEPAAVQFGDLAQLPGQSTKGKKAAVAATGQRSFFFWNFGMPLTELVERFAKRGI